MKQLISWYVNGTLEKEQRQQFELALRSSPDSQTLLAWEHALQSVVSNDPAAGILPDHGLKQVMERIKGQNKPHDLEPQSWLAGLVRQLSVSVSPAFALACGVVAVQFAVIVQIWPGGNQEDIYSQARSLQLSAQKNNVFLKVTFHQDTLERDLRTLINGMGVEIVAGPSQIGDYYLWVGKEEAQVVFNALQTSPYVQAVEIVNELPARQ
jgi:hypothetical protein